ncbi:MAG: hypothetical protein JW866_00990, partial [Ignavibacteriales bacterium]|nr:hypothetical protein [Ignavibacteriales bacterium]
AQYQVWLFSSFESAGKQFSYFTNNLLSEFAYVGLLLSLIGIFIAFKRLKKIAIFLLITFVFTVLYSINYDINDIDAYFLLAYISLSFFSVFCFAELLKNFSKKKFSFRIKPAYFFIIPILILGFNFSKVDQSNIHIFEDYTKAILDEVEKNALIFTYQWDYFVSPAYYFQFVEDYRKDVCIIDKELLRRSWYYLQTQNNYPDVVDGIKGEINAFLDAIKPFERNENFDPNLLENIYRKILTNLFVTNVHERECYIAPELVQNEMRTGEFTLPEGFYLIPEGMLFRVVRENKYYAYDYPNHKIRTTGRKNMYIEQIQTMIPMMYLNRALYEIQYKNIKEAKKYIDKIQKEYPEYKINSEILKFVD